MKRYSAERKESVIQKMMPPHSVPIPRLAQESGISDVTLYNEVDPIPDTVNQHILSFHPDIELSPDPETRWVAPYASDWALGELSEVVPVI